MKLKELFYRDTKELGLRIVGLYALAVLLLGFDLIYLIKVIFSWVGEMPWAANSMPAWVQAIGSVGAIGVAIFIFAHGERRKMDERRDEQFAYMSKVYWICVGALHSVRLIKGVTEKWEGEGSSVEYSKVLGYSRMLSTAVGDLASINPMTLPHSGLVVLYLDIRRAVTVAYDLTQAACENQSEFEIRRIEALAGLIEKRRKEMVKVITDHLPGYPLDDLRMG